MTSTEKPVLGRVDPTADLFFTKSPLPADFERRNFSAFRPEAYGSRRYAEPSRDNSGGEKGIFLLAFQIVHSRMTPKKLRAGINIVAKQWIKSPK